MVRVDVAKVGYAPVVYEAAERRDNMAPMIGYKIHNRISIVGDANTKKRNIAEIDTIMVHRIGVATDGPGVATWFKLESAKTAGEVRVPFMPYTLTISGEGMIEQNTPLCHVAPHGRGWNTRSISVGVIGDFRSNKPTYTQSDALAWLLRWLYQGFAHIGHGSTGSTIVGHSNAPGASADPNKNCPGHLLELASVRDQVQAEIQEDARRVLVKAGLAMGPIGSEDITPPIA